jgi:hypothetical protein
LTPEPPPVPPAKPARETSQRTLLLIGAGAAAIAVLLFAACAGGLLGYAFSGSSAPPDIKVNSTVEIVTTNNNPFWNATAFVLEIRGNWVRMRGTNERDPTVWINFNNVVHYRLVNK